jgi:small subunit ribosomal protein S16
MLRIRLSRKGKKRQPSYRVVVAEKEAKRDGRIVESIGHYNPLTNPPTYQIDEARALHWLSNGAQPSDAVRVLLNKQGTIDRLARLHAGESLEALVTEYTGVAAPAEAVAPAVVEEPAPTVMARVAETAGDAAQAVVAPVAAAVATVGDAVESMVESVSDAIEAVLDADEEE